MNKLLLMIFALSGLTGVPATAQDDLQFSIRHTRVCLGEAVSYSERRQCIGASADACMEATPSGFSTYGMGGCLNFEAEWWDKRLNSSYQSLMKREKASDAEMADLGANEPSKSDALRAMQRAWIPLRDATCDYERSQWGNGTGGGPATVGCLMRMTAEQTLYLEDSALGY